MGKIFIGNRGPFANDEESSRLEDSNVYSRISKSYLGSRRGFPQKLEVLLPLFRKNLILPNLDFPNSKGKLSKNPGEFCYKPCPKRSSPCITFPIFLISSPPMASKCIQFKDFKQSMCWHA